MKVNHLVRTAIALGGLLALTPIASAESWQFGSQSFSGITFDGTTLSGYSVSPIDMTFNGVGATLDGFSLDSLTATYNGGDYDYDLTGGRLAFGTNGNDFYIDFNHAILNLGPEAGGFGADTIYLDAVAIGGTHAPAYSSDGNFSVALTLTGNQAYNGVLSGSVEAVPEPFSIGLGIAGIAAYARRRRIAQIA